MQSAAGGVAGDPNSAAGAAAAAAAAAAAQELDPLLPAEAAPPQVDPQLIPAAPPQVDPQLIPAAAVAPLAAAAAAAATDALLINSIILRDTGRDHGPDFALDNDIIQLETAKTGIDNNNSITEVLNKLAFLCNTTRNVYTLFIKRRKCLVLLLLLLLLPMMMLLVLLSRKVY